MTSFKFPSSFRGRGYQLEGRNVGKNPISHSISRAAQEIQPHPILKPRLPRRNRESIFGAPAVLDDPVPATTPRKDPFVDWPSYSAGGMAHRTTRATRLGVVRWAILFPRKRTRRRLCSARSGNNVKTTNNGGGKLRTELKGLSSLSVSGHD